MSTQNTPLTQEVAAVVTASRPVRWATHRPEYRWLLVGLLAVVLVLFFASKPPAPSPMIGSYVDLLNPEAGWAIASVAEAGNLPFVLSLLFILLLTVWLLLFYGFARGSVLTDDPDRPGGVVRYFQWPTDWADQRAARVLVWTVFPIMFGANLLLFYYYRQALAGRDVTMVTGFYWVYGLALASRLLGLLLGAGTLLQYLINDFGPGVRDFLRHYASYFYPSIIALVIVATVFRSMDQFDSLLIALVQSPRNLAVFALLLFPASIVLIWFAPAYLYFTDLQNGDRATTWENIWRVTEAGKADGRRTNPRRIYRWLALHKRLIVPDEQAGEQPPPVHPNFLSDRRARAVPFTRTFHHVRTLLGFLYIFLLTAICVGILVYNHRNPGYWPVLILSAIFFGGLAYWVITTRRLQRIRRQGDRATPPVGRAGVPRGKYTPSWWHRLLDQPRPGSERAYYYVPRGGHFWTGVAFAVAFFFLLALTLFTGGGSRDYWQTPFSLFVWYLVTSIFLFLWLSIYGRFYGSFTFSRRRRYGRDEAAPPPPAETPGWDVIMDRLDHVTVQLMLLLIPIMAVLALLFFLTGLFFAPDLMPFWARINPLNIYLIFVNGLIAGLILVDRYLMLREQRQQYAFYRADAGGRERYDRLGSVNFFWGAAVVTVLLLVGYLGNGYHRVDYNPDPAPAAPPPLTLEEYTGRFLDRYDPTRPVILVGADGGGLKACYWTMLNLNRIDALGLFDNVFATSGASGGNIGLAMYTYLKARGLTAGQIRQPLENIGRANFLSGDLAGLLTRFPLNYFPDVPGYSPSNWEDRSESMARAYLDIADGGDPRWSYDTVRRLPFAALWQRTDYRLPAFIANTTRAEDGMRGIVHPFAPDADLTAGVIDLSQSEWGYISFPDAAFLSNRFPVMSPVGRIRGKGHFIDGGASDNSGIGTLFQLLGYMKSHRTGRDSLPNAFDRFFDPATGPRRVLLSIRNDKTRFIRDQFYGQMDRLNRNVYQSELGANANAALNTGLSGVPNFWDDYLRSGVPKRLSLVDTFLTADLPFRLRKYDVHAAFSGELSYPEMDARIEAVNDSIEATLGCAAGSDCYIVAPPLGRLLARPSRHYMQEMVDYPDNRRLRAELMRRWE